MKYRVKLKFIASDEKFSKIAARELEEKTDIWLEQNPNVQIKRTTMQTPDGFDGGRGIVLCIEYIEVDISNRELITENEQ
jgi:hypothetical protein